MTRNWKHRERTFSARPIIPETLTVSSRQVNSKFFVDFMDCFLIWYFCCCSYFIAVEIEQMLINQNVNLLDEKTVQMDWPWGTPQPTTAIWAHERSGSGGYSDHLFKYAAKELFGEEVSAIEYKNLRNPDFKEVILERNGQVLLRFAIANGFRNIQNLVQKLKRGKSTYHFVEVMACPSGEFVILWSAALWSNKRFREQQQQTKWNFQLACGHPSETNE